MTGWSATWALFWSFFVVSIVSTIFAVWRGVDFLSVIGLSIVIGVLLMPWTGNVYAIFPASWNEALWSKPLEQKDQIIWVSIAAMLFWPVSISAVILWIARALRWRADLERR